MAPREPHRRNAHGGVGGVRVRRLSHADSLRRLVLERIALRVSRHRGAGTAGRARAGAGPARGGGSHGGGRPHARGRRRAAVAGSGRRAVRGGVPPDAGDPWSRPGGRLRDRGGAVEHPAEPRGRAVRPHLPHHVAQPVHRERAAAGGRGGRPAGEAACRCRTRTTRWVRTAASGMRRRSGSSCRPCASVCRGGPFEKIGETFPDLFTPAPLPVARLRHRTEEPGWPSRWAYTTPLDGTSGEWLRDALSWYVVAAWIVTALAGAAGLGLALGRPGMLLLVLAVGASGGPRRDHVRRLTFPAPDDSRPPGRRGMARGARPGGLAGGGAGAARGSVRRGAHGGADHRGGVARADRAAPSTEVDAGRRRSGSGLRRLRGPVAVRGPAIPSRSPRSAISRTSR